MDYSSNSLHASSAQIASDKRRLQIGTYTFVIACLLPGMVIFLIFFLIPIIQSLYFSFYEWNGLGPLTDYVALNNYDRVLNHSVFQGAFVHTVIILIFGLVVQLPLALFLALLLERVQIVGKHFFRTILFFPFVFSEIITAIIWRYVLHPSSGLLNTILSLFGQNSVALLASPQTVLIGLLMVITWKYFGFYMILYMAGLQNVPQDLESAARVDGAGSLAVLRYVTLPLLGPTIRLTVFISALGALQQFVLIWTLTEGGPVGSSEVIGTYLYKFGLQRFSLGYGSAVAVVLFFVTITFSLTYQYFVMRRDYEIGQG